MRRADWNAANPSLTGVRAVASSALALQPELQASSLADPVPSIPHDPALPDPEVPVRVPVLADRGLAALVDRGLGAWAAHVQAVDLAPHP